jgi:hypothetical protein
MKLPISHFHPEPTRAMLKTDASPAQPFGFSYIGKDQAVGRT